jgi:hypothetical protein
LSRRAANLYQTMAVGAATQAGQDRPHDPSSTWKPKHDQDGAAVTPTITDQLISIGHAVRSATARPRAWEVSWLPGQFLDRNTAITARMLADTASDCRRDEGHRLWPAIHDWVGELGLAGPDAVAQASDQIEGSDQRTARPGRCRIVSERDQWAVPAGSAWSVP